MSPYTESAARPPDNSLLIALPLFFCRIFWLLHGAPFEGDPLPDLQPERRVGCCRALHIKCRSRSHWWQRQISSLTQNKRGLCKLVEQ